MEKYKFNRGSSKNNDHEEPRKTSGHGPCQVYGCNNEGHIYTGNWNCRYHHGKSGESLARITMVLNNHEYAFRWYEKLLQSTIVDFDLGDIAKRAPQGMNVLNGEQYLPYKTRIYGQIEKLLKHG